MAVYNAYIDESGDEGFANVRSPANPTAGGSEWLVLGGVIVPEERDLELSKAIDDLRAYLGKPPRKPLHFRDLKHAAKRAAMLRLANYDFVFSVVALWKPQITSVTLRKAPFLYNYGCRFLIERLSWFAAARARQLDLFFENLRRSPSRWQLSKGVGSSGSGPASPFESWRGGRPSSRRFGCGGCCPKKGTKIGLAGRTS